MNTEQKGIDPSTPSISITIDNTCAFSLEELFPDGIPDTVTTKTVEDLVREAGIHNVLLDWGFPSPALHVDVLWWNGQVCLCPADVQMHLHPSQTASAIPNSDHKETQ